MAKEVTTVSIRMDTDLKARLEARAASNHRNLSQECSRALERSFDAEALYTDAINTLRDEKRLHPMTAGQFAAAGLREICGADAGEPGAWLAVNLALARMLEKTGTKVKVKRADMDRAKAALADIERLVDVEG